MAYFTNYKITYILDFIESNTQLSNTFNGIYDPVSSYNQVIIVISSKQ